MKQREIKFRAWDKKDKVMREVYGIQFPKISNHGDRKNTIIEMHCSDIEGEKIIILSDFTDSIERVELMQFTGLLDKNGIEIYEGDIFGVYSLTGDYAGQDEPFGKVYFDTDMSAYCVEQTNGGWEYLNNVYDNARVSVIGNIYENPSLLK